ncbi:MULTISPECIES: hypothetical protein [Kitasatospora]|uniref:Uncharacterized protein n=1 Tax=Kitasatospora setae (strain ATCC 33774 / DSM 43861 / JCM 3304 / KCC A-0304 / NBRC 14216 / KM-6054) TaxID=452652 RepID=E4NI02_KITSK|nr:MULTISPECIES: hypothetical protein [Kitasatospora]BAJ31132.1 hypothetical protein KSE_53570 [Kitasatospora setae KM-6054]
MNGTGEGTRGDGAMWVELGLAGAAAEVAVGPVPVDGIVAGGRRIRRRRRTAVGALALAAVTVLGGGAAAGLPGAPGGAGTAREIGPAALGGPASPSGPASAPASAPTAVRDPLTPVRVLIGQGVVDGREWQLWEALWPLAPQERAYEQALAVWQERHAVDPGLEAPTEAYVRQYWQPGEDVVNTYATLDGVRQKDDEQGGYPAPGHLEPWMADTFSGGLLAARDKDFRPGPLPVTLAVLALGPGIDKTVVTWTDGTVSELRPVTVGDSPYRRLVVAERPGVKVASWGFYDRSGAALPNAGEKMLTE